MIKLNLPRNKEGKYILEYYPDNGYVKYDHAQIKNAPSGGYSNSYWIIDEIGRYVLKTDLTDSYKCSQYAELLYSEIGRQIGALCADVDVAQLDGYPYVVSKDVCDKESERLTYWHLKHGNEAKEYCLDTILDYMHKFALRNGLKVEPNIRTKFFKYLILDFLCGQIDRHEENILFEIVEENNEKILKLCRFFDNENAFMFHRLHDKLRDIELYKSKLPEGMTYEEYEKELIDQAMSHLYKCYCLLGIDCDPSNLASKMLDMGYFGKSESVVGERVISTYALSLASEIQTDPELMEFYKRINLDFSQIANNIQAQTGFEIPQQYVELAESVYIERKNLIDKTLKQLSKLSLGD